MYALIDVRIQEVTILERRKSHIRFITEDGKEGILPSWQVFETKEKAGDYLLSQRF